jgi:hypothetical protein
VEIGSEDKLSHSDSNVGIKNSGNSKTVWIYRSGVCINAFRISLLLWIFSLCIKGIPAYADRRELHSRVSETVHNNLREATTLALRACAGHGKHDVCGMASMCWVL